ncbi:DUF58 domain-containing protein [Flectobacillus major]|uniref:DUF58 domain-containing protein n=1 Tax=Flectobacillus major TaxID=103 RepID=UPI0005C642F0|nr:DUF58 domain-containing protein [Flectobacillus major]
MKTIKSIYLAPLVYYSLVILILLFILAFVFPFVFNFALLFTSIFGLLLVTDIFILYGTPKGIFARRAVPERLSNGDTNAISIYLENHYALGMSLEVIDEIPFQFQKRDLLFLTQLASETTQIIQYTLRPTKRGEYSFGAVNIFVKSPLGLLKKRYQFSQEKTVAVYPSFLQMREYELKALSNRLTETGIKKIRRIGHSQEFEQIRQYVQGDDIRTINWQATARRSELMVNTFQDEKSQNIYCLIDKGRVMKMPFEGLSLLDYAINSTLVLANIALQKQDKAGVITFSNKIDQTLLADRKAGQLVKILDLLYKQKTLYSETDYEAVYIHTKKYLKQRSLLICYTNFDTLSSMKRQLPFFRKLAKEHLVLVVFFENTSLKTLLQTQPTTTEEIYQKTIAEKYFYEKQLIVKELEKFGIQALLTTPQNLSINTINKYLMLKARGAI